MKRYWIRFKDGGYSDGFTIDGLRIQLRIPDSEHVYGGVAEFGEMSEPSQEPNCEVEWTFTAEDMADIADESRMDILREDRKIADAIIRQVIYPRVVEMATRGEKYVDIPQAVLNYYTTDLLVKVLGEAGFDASCKGNGHFVIDWGDEEAYWRDF